MNQLPIFTTSLRLSGAMAAIRAAMREAAGSPESEGRKLLVDKLNGISERSSIKLTGGNNLSISKATLDKWLSPSDTSHPPSLLALLAFCIATDSLEPFRVAAQVLGVDVMTEEDKKLRDYGQAVLEMKEARKRKKKLEETL